MQGQERRPRPSSFSHHRWSQLSPPHPSPITAMAGPSNRQEPALNESAWAYRTMALRQMNTQPRPWPRARRQTISTTTNNPSNSGHRTSRPVSQPVLVRTYSGNTGENSNSSKPTETNKPSSASQRRSSFAFMRNAVSSEPQDNGPSLPSPEEFSIEAILRTIEPSIQLTLNSIAEIYGRSKLSLANEYGSHIAPLGEIRAPPGYLLTVDEASSEQERQQEDDGVDAVELCYRSFVPFSVAGDRSSVQAQPDTPRSTTETNPGFDFVDPGFEAPVTREFAEGVGSCGRNLLGGQNESVAEQSRVTPAVVSEIHLDAQADSQSNVGHDQTTAEDNGPRPPLSVLGGLQSFFSRIAQYGQSNSCRQSAEVQLRAMLQRDLSAD